jgi:hypothetical protein
MGDKEVDRRREGLRPSGAGGTPRGRALDPFFIFTYSLLALALGIQVLIMVWMDLF